MLEAALRYAGCHTRSILEVRTYLARRGASAEETSCAIAECQARNLLDDRACARLWADHWARQGYAWAAIHAKLTARGLDAVARDAAIPADAAADDAARARTLIGSRRAQGDTGRARVRAARRLAGKGFDPDLIAQLLEESFGSSDVPS